MMVTASIPTLEEQTSVNNIDSLVLRCSRQFHIPSEAQYILRNLLDALIQNKAELAKVQADNKVDPFNIKRNLVNTYLPPANF
jgi:hypothetical protein